MSMPLVIRGLALLILCSLPVAISAQTLGAGAGWWTTTGGKGDEAAAHGLRVHGTISVRIAQHSVDLEGAFSQSIFTRAFVTGKSRANENSLEIAPLVPFQRANTAWWPYIGPMVSIGIGCGTSGANDPNGKIACGSGARSEGSVRLGIAAGIAYSKPAGSLNLTVDFRGQANTVAAARGSGPVLLFALGIRGR